MNWTENLLTKRALWIVAGASIGVIGTATFLSGTGLRPSIAQTQTPQAKLAKFEAAGAPTIATLDQTFADLTEQFAPSVVHIRVGKMNGGNQMMSGEGSGFVYSSDGWIITNDHVVEGADSVTVVFNDGRELKGVVRRAKDSQNDVAVVKVDASGLPVAKIADSGLVRPGQFALAFGAPFGLENTVTIGHISGLGRNSAVNGMPGQLSRGYSSMIQTDAAINPGNSGGPLVNIHGEVIGVNTSILSTGPVPASAGVGFAIPSNQVKLIADKLIANQPIKRVYLGLLPADLTPYEKKQKNIEFGAVIREVTPAMPAAKAGLKEGDIIVKIGDIRVRNEQDLRNAMLGLSTDRKVSVEFTRDGKTMNADMQPVGSLPMANNVMPNQDPRQMNPDEFFKRFDDNNQGDVRERLKELLKDPSAKGGAATPDRTPAPSDGKLRLGVMVTELTPELRKEYNIPESAKGLLVTEVQGNTLAERMGIPEGALIHSVDGVTVTTPEELKNRVLKFQKGKNVSVEFSTYKNGTIRSTSSIPY